MDLHRRASNKNASHKNAVLTQDTTHLIQRPRYQRRSPCQDPAGNRTTQRPPDHGKETKTAVVWSCLLFIRSGQNHQARHSEEGKKTRQTEEEVGRQHQRVDRPAVRQVPEGSGKQTKQKNQKQKRRKLVVKSSVVPQRPPRLRAKWRKGAFNCCSEISFSSRFSFRKLDSKSKNITIPPPTSFFLSFGAEYHAVSSIILLRKKKKKSRCCAVYFYCYMRGKSCPGNTSELHVQRCVRQEGKKEDGKRGGGRKEGRQRERERQRDRQWFSGRGEGKTSPLVVCQQTE